MCLIAASNRLTSHEDIIGYKVLVHKLDGRIVSPFYHYKYSKFNEVLTDYTDESISYDGKQMYITSGFFHAYVSLKHAIKIAKSINMCLVEDTYIYLAKIPANTEYYIGREGDICAKSIIITDKIVQ